LLGSAERNYSVAFVPQIGEVHDCEGTRVVGSTVQQAVIAVLQQSMYRDYCSMLWRVFDSQVTVLAALRIEFVSYGPWVVSLGWLSLSALLVE
jgi:hypothetical protein